MAIKEDLTEIKKEIGAQEQFLESVIKSERFFYKNKKLFIVIFVAIIVAISAMYVAKFIDKKRVDEANVAYSKLILNADDTAAINVLKEKEPSLYALFMLKKALDKNDTASAKELLNLPVDPIVKQIISTQTGGESDKILKDYSTILKGYELLKEGKTDEANAEFIKIPIDSELQNLIKNLQHYKGNK